MKHELGLVIGKFLPPHRGHRLLIESACEQSERVVLIVCAKPADSIPGERRQEWLRELHPRCEVRLIDDRYDEQDSAVWAENTLRWLGRAPSAVFSSEEYGPRYARLMGARHVLVDRERVREPISGTAVRGDPFAHWAFLDAPVRAWFARRVCVLGAESTGTTTLARALAQGLATVWVEEYGREYSEHKFRRGEQLWTSPEFEHIATEQLRREDQLARQANRVLVCDTNAFATMLWERRYVGRSSPAVAALGRSSRCDLYLLTGDEIPFVQDGLRDGEHIRHEMQGWFKDALATQAVAWYELHGSEASRLAQALGLVRVLFADSSWKP